MPQGYDPSNFPQSYKDPLYDSADQTASSALGLPDGLLSSIRLKGEKSNADQISSANAASPYQITPTTRAAILKQTGVDPYLNPQSAAYGAAYLLKQSMDRNGGSPQIAAAEYNAGTDQSKWGPGVQAYVKRVTGQSVAAAQASGGTPQGAGSPTYSPDQPSQLQQVYQAYKSGQMAPADAAQFEQDVNSGRITLPAGANVKAPEPEPQTMEMAPQSLVDAYHNGQMAPQDAAQFRQDVDSNAIALPPGVELGTPSATPMHMAGVAARGALTGATEAAQNEAQITGSPITAPLPIAAVNSLMQSAPAAVDRMLGTHMFAPNVANQHMMGLPQPQTPNEQVVEKAGEGAGMMAATPIGGIGELPLMVAGGAAGGAVGQAVTQHTGSPLLGMAANLLTTALSPAAASRVMRTLVGEVGAREALAGAAGTPRIEPTMPAQPAESAPSQAAAQPPAEAPATPPAQPSAPLGTQPNPGTPQVTNPAISALQQEREGLLPAAANAPAKGDTSIQDQMGALAGRTFDSVQDRTRALQATGMKFQDARALAQRQIDGEMSAYQNQLGGLQSQLNTAQEGSRAAQRIQEIDEQIAQMNATAPAQRTPIASAVEQAMQPAARTAPEAAAPAAEATAAPAVEAAPAAAEAAPAQAAEPAIESTPLVPDDPEQRAQIIQLMQNASGQNKTISADAVQAARNELLARFRIDPQAADAARNLGMIDDLHPDHLATDIQMIKLNQLLKSDPSNPMAAQEAAGLTRVGQRAIGLFNEMGAAPDISALSQKANQMLGEQNASLKGDVHNILDNQIPSMVPKNSQVPATNSIAMINEELGNLGGQSHLLSKDWRRAQALLSPRDEMVSVGGQQIPGSRVGIPPTNPTYHAVDTLRKQLNAADRGTGPFVNMEQGARRRLAQTLSQDQGAYLQSANPDAHALWQQANAKVQMYKAVQDDMQTLFGKSTEQSMLPTLKNAIQGLQSGNVENFNRVVSAIPKSMRNEVLTTTLQNMFTRAGSNELGPFGFQQFSNFFKSFKKDSASYSALMANLEPDARSTLSKLISVSDRISGSISQKIYTGRSRFAKDLVAELNDVPTTVIDRMRSAIGPAAGRAVGGAATYAAHHIPVVGPVVSPMMHGVGNFAAWAISPNRTPVERALSDFITSEDARDILARGPQVTDQQIAAAANSPTFNRLYSLARGAAANDSTTRERWLRGLVNASGQAQQNNGVTNASQRPQ